MGGRRYRHCQSSTRHRAPRLIGELLYTVREWTRARATSTTSHFDLRLNWQIMTSNDRLRVDSMALVDRRSRAWIARPMAALLVAIVRSIQGTPSLPQVLAQHVRHGFTDVQRVRPNGHPREKTLQDTAALAMGVCGCDVSHRRSLREHDAADAKGWIDRFRTDIGSDCLFPLAIQNGMVYHLGLFG